MKIFYVSKDLAITDRDVTIRRPPEVRIPIVALRSVRAEQHVTAPVRHRSGLVQLAGGALALALISAPVLDSPAVLISALLTFATAATLSRAGRRPRTTVWELRAMYRNVEICLHRTTQEREFNQIKRALLRALEANERY